jgi:hypothetical protein
LESKSSLFQYLPRIAGILIILTGLLLISDSYMLGLFDGFLFQSFTFF